MTTLALLGAAHIHTPGFIERLKKRSDVRVTTVWDHDPARAAKAAEALGARVVATPAAVWSEDSIAGVIVCTETDRHEDLVLQAAVAGRHLFVEKPLGLGAADAYRMADAIERAGVLFQTGYFNRGVPAHLFLKQHLEAGTFGTITRARHSNCHHGSLGGWFDTQWRWMADPQIAGCGAFGDLGTHSLDILLWLFGEVERVTGVIRTVTGRYDTCDESGEALLQFRNGVIATLAAGWVDVANPVRALVSGTTGHATLVEGQLFVKSEKLSGADGKAPWTDLPAELPHAFDLFLDAVTGRPDVPLVGAREAAYRSDVMEAIYRGAADNVWATPTGHASA